MVFSTSYEKFIAYRIAQGCHRQSYYHLGSTWLPLLADKPLPDITTDDIQEHVDTLAKQRKWSHQTRTVALTTLSAYFNWAVARGYVEKNPVKNVPRRTGLKLNNDRRYVISKEDLKKLLRILTLTPAIHDFFLIGLKTGLRFGKIANLSPKDVHQDLDGIWFIEVEDKNGELFRTFCFGEVQEIILRWKALAEEKGYDVLIHGPNGGKMRQKYVRPYLMTACRAVGIPWGRGRYQFTFHSTRRAFATYLLNSGVSIERVMEAGNWKSFASVQRYAKLSTASKKDALRSVEKLLSV